LPISWGRQRRRHDALAHSGSRASAPPLRAPRALCSCAETAHEQAEPQTRDIVEAEGGDVEAVTVAKRHRSLNLDPEDEALARVEQRKLREPSHRKGRRDDEMSARF